MDDSSMHWISEREHSLMNKTNTATTQTCDHAYCIHVTAVCCY